MLLRFCPPILEDVHKILNDAAKLVGDLVAESVHELLEDVNDALNLHHPLIFLDASGSPLH